MRIAASSDDRLVVEHRPVTVALAIWAAAVGAGVAATGESLALPAMLLALGAALAALAWRHLPLQRFVFDRRRAVLERTEWRPPRRRTDTMPLARVRRARQQAEWSDGIRLTRLALELDDRVLPLGSAYGSRDLDRVEAAINARLAPR